MARIESWFTQDLKEPVKVRYLDGNVFSADSNGNMIAVRVFDGGEPATLSGTVSANIIRADGATIVVAGTLNNNVADVVLPQDAYAVPGPISIAIKITNGNDITTLAAVVSNVFLTDTGTVDPGTVETVEALIAAINAAIASIPADYSSLWATLAPPFSNTNTYRPGQYVTYGGLMYMCTASHNGDWNSSHFAPVDIGKMLTMLMDAITDRTFTLTFTAGQYVDKSSGNLVSMPSGPYSSSNACVVDGLSRLIWFNSLGGDAAGYAFMTKDGLYVSGGDGYISAGQNSYGVTILDVPKNAYYFACSNHTGWNFAAQLYGIAIDKYDPLTMISYPFTLFPGFYASKSTGKLTKFASGPYAGSTAIPIYSDKIYVYAACATDDAGYAFLDSEMNLIAGGNCYVSNSKLGEIELDVPKEARFFRFSSYSTLNRKSTYVRGVPTRIHNGYCDSIPWLDGYAYNAGSDTISEVSGAAASDGLFLRQMEPALRGWLYSSNYFYMTLYNKENVYVGKKTPGGIYDGSGNLDPDLDYYSFTMTLANPYPLFKEQEIYFQQAVKHVRVDVDTVAKLQTAMLNAAKFANPCKVYDIYIAAGTYDLWNGLDWSQISGSGDDAYKRGLELVSYCNLYGIGNCVLDLTVPSSGRQYSTVVSCLNAHGSECTVRNITLTTYDGRYCVHDDSYPNWTADKVITWENCVFEYRGRPDDTYTTAQHCYGAGYYSGFKAIFRDCVFKGGNSASDGWTGVGIHGHSSTGVGSNVVDLPFYAEIENCAFLGVGRAILPNAVSGGLAHQYDFHVDNCYFAPGNKIALLGTGGNRLFGGGNSPVEVTQAAQNEIYFNNVEDMYSELTFNANLTNKIYTKCSRDRTSGLTVLQVYFDATADIAGATALISNLPVPVGGAPSFVVTDFVGGTNSPAYMYVDNGVLKKRGVFTSGHTLFGTVAYFAKIS